MRKERREY